MLKKYTICCIVLFVVLLSVASVQAGSLWFDADGVFLVPASEMAPVIDGVMDQEVYWTVKSAPDTADMNYGGEILDFYDFYCTHRMVWHNDILYIFVSVYDDVLSDNQSVATWQQDNVELYFDGDNSKGEAYDGIDDIQLRWTYDEGTTGDGVIDVGYGEGTSWDFDPDVIEWAIVETELGYDLEIAIPIADLGIDVGQEFGFETQIGDNDDDGGNAFYRWNWNGGDSWRKTINHGTAKLIKDRIVSDVLDINLISAPPDIDGELDDVWMEIPEVSMNTYVTIPETEFYDLDEWDDLMMDFRTAWDEEYFYLFVTVVDDYIETELGAAWEKDGLEILFNGVETGSGETPPAPVQERWIFDDETIAPTWPNSEHAWFETELGYNFELKIPFDELADIEPEEFDEFGFELQVNDNDGDDVELRENMARWWSNDNDAWQNSEMLGRAMLIGESGSAVEKAPAATPHQFILKQNYPNPFNPLTMISYELSRPGIVSLNVYNVAGELVAVLVDESVQSAGEHSVTFDGRELSCGVYICRMQTDAVVMTKKMMLIK
ncbi:T9SS type A sorting domain-containing protein [candidate division KSB1 bacterium]|nr:T9SS type A sorting domain-containing protein [candidate division KSB1 bacterium]